MSYDDLVNALRATDGNDAELAAATRLRLRRSLERDTRRRSRLLAWFTSGGILFAGTAAWALKGEIASLWAPKPSAQIAAPATVEPPPDKPSSPVPRRVTAVVPVAPVAIPDEPIAPPPVKIARAMPPIERAAPRIDTEVLFKTAHELHFHGNDPAATLSAWDAYLAAAPHGALAVEARYNRALVLIRLQRYAEARAALLPFSRGEIAGSYRQDEAAQLVERLARFE